MASGTSWAAERHREEHPDSGRGAAGTPRMNVAAIQPGGQKAASTQSTTVDA